METKKEMIPLTEDVMKLNNILKSTEEEARQELLDGPNPKAYRTLSESLLSQIILFNRRRQGEAAKIPLLTYKNRVIEEPNEDIMKCLSKLEQSLSKEFTRLAIRGKRGRKVPVLLTRDMTESLDFLVNQRNELNEVLDSNECLCKTKLRITSTRLRLFEEIRCCMWGEKARNTHLNPPSKTCSHTESNYEPQRK